MLSFAYRSSHGIRKHPIDPLCRAYLHNLGSSRSPVGRRARLPAAAGLPNCRGIAQTGPLAARKIKAVAAASRTSAKSKKKAAAAKETEEADEATDEATDEADATTEEDPKKAAKKAKKAKKASEPEASKEPEKAAKKAKKAKKSSEPEASTEPKAKKKAKKGSEPASLTVPFSEGAPFSKEWAAKTPEELTALWVKSMDILDNLNKIGRDKLTKSQVTLMAGTLDVIKTVLTAQARKITRAGDEAQSPARADADAEGEEAGGESLATMLAEELTGRRKLRFESPGSIPNTLQDSRPAEADTKIPGWHKKHKGSVKVLEAGGFLKPLDVETPPVPLIQYGLDRVLFNEGVYVLQDFRTGVYNFDPYLAKIMPVTEFDFDALKEYTTSSKDQILLGVTRKARKKYTGSTSSMTATLAHFHFLLSAWREISLARISREYEPDNSNFVSVMKAPAATFLNYNDGVYAIDADKQWDNDTILSMLGKSMEMLLTAPKADYEKYRREVSHKLTEEERNTPESYHYTEFGDFVMRSQLDAYDPRLPGTGVYDLKTRAVVSIRMDAQNYENGRPYEIRKHTGEWESFEREYHDMIRGAFLKYSLQVRMGRMDGIFVAYHNTQRIFGFQYIPLEEMDQSIHGTKNTTLGDKEFQTSLTLWNMMLNKATERFPEQSLRVHVETRPSQTPFMYFFAEPVVQEEIDKIQVKDRATVETFREKVLGISPSKPTVDEADLAAETDQAAEDAIAEEGLKSTAAGEEDSTEPANAEETTQAAEDEDSEEVWEDIMSVVEQTMENDVRGITAIRDAIEEALQQSGLLKEKSSENAQHYIDSLLRAIVDVEGQKTEADSHEESPSTPIDEPGSESEAAQEARASQEPVDGAPVTAETQSSGSSPLGFFSKMFSAFKAPAKEVSEPETKEVSEPEETMRDAAASQSSELVDLIIKMTSRAGLSSSRNEARAVQDVSDDQAKLRNFETLLSELVAADESGEAEPKAASPKKDDGPKKPVFGMILTSRNKVNNDYVDRPQHLTAKDEWKIEYRMEEIPEDKVHSLYRAMQTRRKKAYAKSDPHGRRFEGLFDGNLKRYSRAGGRHRAAEDKLDKMQRPNFLVGHSDPIYWDRSRSAFPSDSFPKPVSPIVEATKAARKKWENKKTIGPLGVPYGHKYTPVKKTW